MKKILPFMALLVVALVLSGCIGTAPAPGSGTGPATGTGAGAASGTGAAPVVPPKNIIPPSQDEQLFTKAANEKNVSYCGQIQNEGIKVRCFRKALTAETPASECGQFSGADDKDKCYNNLVTITKNTSLCENIANETRKEACLKKS